MASFKKIKEILNLQEQDYFGGAGNPFADIINKDLERARKEGPTTQTNGNVDHTDGDDDSPWDPDDPNSPIPCNDSPHGCEGCPGGNPEGCYVDENGNYYVSMLIWICCDATGNPFLQEMLVTTAWEGGPLVGVFCTADVGCQYLILREDNEGNLHATQILWVAGNRFYRAVRVWSNGGWITVWQVASCNSNSCLYDESSWNTLNGPHPEDLDTWEFYVWNGQRFPIGNWEDGRIGPNWGLYVNPFGGEFQVGVGVSFPLGVEDNANAEYNAYQTAWNSFVWWWIQNALPGPDGTVPPPPQPWPEGWTWEPGTPPDEGWG